MKTEQHIEPVAPIQAAVPANIFLWTIGAFLLIFLLWAGLTEIDRTIRAAGRVIPSSQLQVISNLEGGIVEGILVRTGEQVKQGAALIRLNPIQPGSDLAVNRTSSDVLSLKTVRLEAEMAGREPDFPVARDPVMASQIAVEQGLHRSRLAEFSSLMMVNSARIDQARRAVLEAEAAQMARNSARDTARAELQLVRPLVLEGIEPRRSLLQAENGYNVAAADAAAAAAALARSQAAVAEAQASAAQDRRDWFARTAGELTAARGEAAARQAALPAYEYKLERTIVRAPMDGRINRVFATTIGGSVRPGDPLLEMVPGHDNLLIEILVAAKDIASVRLDQRAKIDITAYDSAIYGSMDGRVIAISPDAVVNERTGESHYLVRVRTMANAIMDRNGRRLLIGPGMGAEVKLLGDKRTVLAYILTPLTRLRETAFRE